MPVVDIISLCFALHTSVLFTFSAHLLQSIWWAIIDRIHLVASRVDAGYVSLGVRVWSLGHHYCHSHCSRRFGCGKNSSVNMRSMSVRFLNDRRLAMRIAVSHFDWNKINKWISLLMDGYILNIVPIPRMWCGNIFFRFRQRWIDFSKKVFNWFSIFFFRTKYFIHITICCRCLCWRLRWLSIRCRNVLGHWQR